MLFQLSSAFGIRSFLDPLAVLEDPWMLPDLLERKPSTGVNDKKLAVC